VTDPVDFEEMAAEQTRCLKTQHLLGGIAGQKIVKAFKC
jgi:hypothetical protein